MEATPSPPASGSCAGRDGKLFGSDSHAFTGGFVMRSAAPALFAVSLTLATTAFAQLSGDLVRIGVLSDMSGLYADVGGPGSVAAARMAIADFGGAVGGKKIELVSADHQNKPDIGSAIARHWFDND